MVLVSSTHLGRIFTGGILLSGFRNKMLYKFLITLMRATCLTHSIPFICSLQYHLVNLTDYEIRYRTVFPGLYHFLPTRSKYFPQCRAPKSPSLVGGIQLERGSQQCKNPLLQKSSF